MHQTPTGHTVEPEKPTLLYTATAYDVRNIQTNS